MKRNPEKNRQALDALAIFLRTGTYTARQIADETKCSIPVVYSRIKGLEKRGVAVVELRSPSGRSGPWPVSYGVK